jgi:thiamine kinase-like enzyme
MGVVADGTRVYSINDDGTSILKASPPAFPGVIRELTQKQRIARDVLGENLGRHVAQAFQEWEVDGVSCAFFEKLTPIASSTLKRFLQLRKVTAPVLKWLREVASLDQGPSEQMETCLRALTRCRYEYLHAPANQALDRLTNRAFEARARVMHGDLTLGNVMLDPSGALEFVIIDWRGANMNGFPIFDLIKFAETARLRPGILRAELEAHADRLGCELQDTRSYLLAAFGYIWLNLDQFPPERFADMAKKNLNTLDSALDV